MMHDDDDNDDDKLMIHSYDDDKQIKVRSTMIIDNHVTVMEIVIINSGHKLAVMAVAVNKNWQSWRQRSWQWRPQDMLPFNHLVT